MPKYVNKEGDFHAERAGKCCYKDCQLPIRIRSLVRFTQDPKDGKKRVAHNWHFGDHEFKHQPREVQQNVNGIRRVRATLQQGSR